MALKEIIQQILGEAEDKAKAIKEEGSKEAERILNEKKAFLDEQKKKFDDETKKMCEILVRKELTLAEFELKNKLLRIYTKAISETYEKALHELEKTGPKKREEIVRALIKNAESELGNVKTIYVNKNDKKFVVKYKAVEKEITGGIIAEDETGRVSLDYSVTTILGDIKEKKVEQLAKILIH